MTCKLVLERIGHEAVDVVYHLGRKDGENITNARNKPLDHGQTERSFLGAVPRGLTL
jgi:hypothetical protein